MVTHLLKAFQYSGVTRQFTVKCAVEKEGFTLQAHFRVEGPTADLLLPPDSVTPLFRDGLYHHTCFEIFVMGKTQRYLEWNFSPSRDWALFAFDHYRRSSEQTLDTKSPWHVVDFVTSEKSALDLKVTLNLQRGQKFLSLQKQTSIRVALSAVLEGRVGGLTYWALAHAGDKPDFHSPDSFAVMIEKKGRAQARSHVPRFFLPQDTRFLSQKWKSSESQCH